MRHVQNLVSLGADVSVYQYRPSKEGSRSELPGGVTRVADLGQALLGAVDAVVVANRTDQHLEVAIAAGRAGKALFIEKPLAPSLLGMDELSSLESSAGLVVEAGFMLRFHPNLKWIKGFMRSGQLGKLLHLRASVGQHLSNWRPGTDHRQGYGARRDWGGGVIFDLIHELDLMAWLAGPVCEVSAMTRYIPSLGIETEAIAQIGLRLDAGVLAQVQLDYVRPGYARTLEIVGELGVLNWDYLLGMVSLSLADGTSTVVHKVSEYFVRNSMFFGHMEYFLRRISDPTLPPSSSLSDGINALRIALACHCSAEQGRHVPLAEMDSNYRVKGDLT